VKLAGAIKEQLSPKPFQIGCILVIMGFCHWENIFDGEGFSGNVHSFTPEGAVSLAVSSSDFVSE
jgi:hypothetical protein